MSTGKPSPQGSEGGDVPASNRPVPGAPAPAPAPAATPAPERASPLTGLPPVDPSNMAMLRQLYVNLCVQHGLCAPAAEDEGGWQAHRDAAEILAAARRPDCPDHALSWAAAYRVEQLLVRILPPPELRAELARRAAGQAASPDPERKALAQAAEALLAAAEFDALQARGVLLRLVSARQWDKTERTQVRTLAALYRKRLNLFCVAALLLFLGALYVNVAAVIPLGWTHGVGGGYSGLLTAIAAGLFGASFSALVRSRKVTAVSIEEMKAMASISQIAARLMVGCGGAAIVYFFFETGLIQGQAIPDLDNLVFSRVGPLPAPEGAKNFGELIPNTEISLLMIWSFLAGFSESFVPRMLTQVEGATSAGGRSNG